VGVGFTGIGVTVKKIEGEVCQGPIYKYDFYQQVLSSFLKKNSKE
jgi:hypothetical protein